MNVQAAEVASEDLEGYGLPASADARSWPRYPGADAASPGASMSPWPEVASAAQAPGAKWGTFDEALVHRQAAEALKALRGGARPVVLAGSAVRTSGCLESFLKLIDALGVPVCTAWNAHDLLPTDHRLFCGRPGTLGDRAGNFAVQNADVLLSLGCRLNVRQIGYESAAFARHAVRIVVDIDEAELAKPTIRADLPVHSDVALLR